MEPDQDKVKDPRDRPRGCLLSRLNKDTQALHASSFSSLLVFLGLFIHSTAFYTCLKLLRLFFSVQITQRKSILE